MKSWLIDYGQPSFLYHFIFTHYENDTKCKNQIMLIFSYGSRRNINYFAPAVLDKASNHAVLLGGATGFMVSSV